MSATVEPAWNWSTPREVAPGLSRWTAPHPDWRPSKRPGSEDDWEQMVGSVLYETTDAVVLFDPLMPVADRALWDWFKARLRGRRVVVLTTLKWHRRSRDDFVERYGAATSSARQSLPRGVEAIRLRGAGETLFWLPEPGALVVGDRILADGRGGLRMCPDSWMSYLAPPVPQAQLRRLLAPVAELPVKLVLVSHGEPVLTGAAPALRALLD